MAGKGKVTWVKGKTVGDHYKGYFPEKIASFPHKIMVRYPTGDDVCLLFEREQDYLSFLHDSVDELFDRLGAMTVEEGECINMTEPNLLKN